MNAMNTDTADYRLARQGLVRRGREALSDLWADKARLRKIAMTWGVGIVLAISLTLWLTGGRFVGTDDAYVHAQKLAVSTDVSGLVKDVAVKEGDHVKKGQVLFRLDPTPFEIAIANDKAALAQAALDVDAMRADYRRMLQQSAAQSALARVNGVTASRLAALVRQNAISKTQYDQAAANYQNSQSTLAALQDAAKVQLAKLGGDPNAPASSMPSYMRAKAALAEAQRQLDHATVRAPFDGIVSEVDSLQPGTLVISAMSAFSTTSAVGLVSDKNIWIDAAMKETDLTNVRIGNPVEVTVDTYPGCTWTGTIDSVAAASDSAFSPMPMENTSGNWVKVVQRIPTKIKVEPQPKGGKCDRPLRAGMSTIISIDTGHRRWWRMLFGG
jgi:membrane fusion protein (multidrug efflux system)